ncbi:response regulator [Fibrella sp. HMF5335]|uniref:Response regulator n=1 Tax=Fibrella rubiginis TaxID=2817060 RepID=A0A939GLB1_9BACT|nr:response regulator [Fibrella rubiginis]MBO0939973.1 response regulator [Fibrella rubiginis]
MSLKGPIVLVDDDEDDQYLIELSLKSLQLPNELRLFGNGLDALTYLQTTQEQPFIILCDVNMPIMNGIELRRQINEDEYLRKKSIPFIFLTTASNAQLVQEAYDTMVQGFFRKAPDFAGLEKQIKCIIEYWQACLHPNKV